ncbi:set domain containing protein [Niveomyces insectorum RCEF 264]|uniref:Set domain containing protein n=1 Tax=Niveomyces insectorum RCEF 264 TaxID=1081102 RepID=A0A162L0S8_9HYPO|nr:set domain containing protein [Niveomyces insectorum RCEF 264]
MENPVPRCSLAPMLAVFLAASHVVGTAQAAAYTYAAMSPVDPELCATTPQSFFRQKLLGPPTACPVPLGRGGQRQHRWLPGAKQRRPENLIADLHQDPSDPQNWFPWTHRPVCGAETNYCVFSLATLPASSLGSGNGSDDNGGDGGGGGGEATAQGISILTTPEMAAYTLHPHQFAWYADALRMFDPFAAESPAFAIGPVGTGSTAATKNNRTGAVATRRIRAGEPVLVDRPVVLAHFKQAVTDENDATAARFGGRAHQEEDDHGLGRESAADRQRLWRAAVDQLPPAVARRLHSDDMHVLPRYAQQKPTTNTAGRSTAAKPASDPAPPPQLAHEEQVFASNAFMVNINGYPMKALFPNVADFNHDCRPNLIAHISEVPLTMVLWAARDIHPGEELAFSYIPDPLPFKKRQEIFRRRWDFDCQCALCTDSSQAARNASDARRARLPHLRRDIQTHLADGHKHLAMAAAKEARDVYAEEGLMRSDTAAIGFDGKPVADAFGPSGLAETLGWLYAEVGDVAAALPQLRAALAETQWRSAGWPSPDDVRHMAELQRQIAELEGDRKRKW